MWPHRIMDSQTRSSIVARALGWLRARSAALCDIRPQRSGGRLRLRDGVDHPQVGAPELGRNVDQHIATLTAHPVALLHASDQLLPLTLHLVEVVIGELAPLLPGPSPENS